MSDTTSSPVLRAQQVSKHYRLYPNPGERARYLLGLSPRNVKLHIALQEVSFSLAAGQSLGVVGDNGAGKSTLLKILAGSLHPTSGVLERTGQVTSILELGAGFHPELTGWQNLTFAASLQGLLPDELLHLQDDIVAFAELQDAMDMPLKAFSSGMAVRLAFALVTAKCPALLIVDEALSVGDQHFQKKSSERIARFREQGCAIVFCSHSLYHVRQLCERTLWLDRGEVKALDDTDTTLAAYERHIRQLNRPASRVTHGTSSASSSTSTAAFSALPAWTSTKERRGGLTSARIQTPPAIDLAHEGAPAVPGPDLVVEVEAVTAGSERPSFGVMLEQAHGVGITSMAQHADGALPTLIGESDGWSQWCTRLTFPDFPMHSGEYKLSFYLFDANGLVVYDEWKDHLSFHWTNPSLTPGLVHLPHRWS